MDNSVNFCEASSDQVQIKIANEEWEKERIYQFRYQVFIEEIAKSLTYVDHKRRQFFDDLDKTSILLYAQAGNKVVGTMRITLGEPDQFPLFLSEIFTLHKFKEILNTQRFKAIGLSTKFAIAPAFRGSTLMYKLVSETIRICQDNNIQFFFGGCNPHLIPLYERVGWRRFTKNFTDDNNGLLVPLLIIPEDTLYLKQVKSPLYRVFKQRKTPSVLSEKFQASFPEYIRHHNTQLITHDFLWNHLRSKFNDETIPPFLKNMSKEDALSFFQLGAIFLCNEGDCIVNYGEMSNGLYFLLTGVVAQKSISSNSQILLPGQFFGGDLVTSVMQTKKVTAVTQSEIIIIPLGAFKKFLQFNSNKASKILNHLADQELKFNQSINTQNILEENL
jgi:predicted GNAT family N-acyltransferase